MSFQPEPPDSTKRQLRATMRERLASCPPEHLESASASIAKRLVSLIPEGFAGRLLGFHSTPKEPAVYFSLRRLFPRATILLPRVADGGLTLHEVDAATPLILNRYQIPEPGPEYPISPERVATALIPGLAFDATGARLGRGGGYYDRLLAELPCACLRIGLCFDFQVIDCVPRASHDLPVHRVVTDLREFVA